MNWTNDKLDYLRNLETAIVGFWRAHPNFSDYGAGLAYEAAYQRYRAEARGHVPKPPELRGQELEAFEALQRTCEFLLGRAPCPGPRKETVAPITAELLVDCLRELKKSVERHTGLGGHQGYLKFVNLYLK